MKALNVDDRKAGDFREDGRALFPGAQWRTAYESPSDNEVYPIDRFGYAGSVDRGPLGDSFDRGRYALESEPEGINYFVGGKPCHTGKDN